MNKQRGFAPVLILIVIALVGVIGYLEYKNYKLPDQLIAQLPGSGKSSIPSILPTFTPVPTNQYGLPDYYNRALTSDFRDALNKVFEGTIDHNLKDGNLSYYFYGEEGYFGIMAYLYEPGNTKSPAGYEGMKWERDIQKEIDQFLSLKDGVQTAKFETVGGLDDATTTLRKIGSRKYAIVDEPFSPAGCYTRYYYTFDPKTKQLVYIKLTFYIQSEVKFELNKESVRINIEYPENVNRYILQFEKNILQKLTS